jgi:2-phosphosulfolactate phosphatase
MRIDLIPSIEYINDNELKGKTVILIDVLRATSVITTALNNGALKVIPKIEIKDALEAKRENCLLGGERKALKIEGFDLTNSPLDYRESVVKGKTIVMTTTNGTKAIYHSLKADKIIIGCMLNGKAIADSVCKEKRDLSLICAGTGGKFSLDDFICAGKIIYECMALGEHELEDFAATAFMAYRDNKTQVMNFVSMASHYKYLESIGLEEDIKYCFTEDLINIVPQVVYTGEEVEIGK